MHYPDFSSLSKRELKIMELATDGLTDQQIAIHLGLTVATVNSYWVRIRGKLGRFSRTELVSRWLQNKSLAASREHKQRIAQLEAQLDSAKSENWTWESAALMQCAFDHNPEVALILDADGRILCANERAASLLGVPRENLLDSNIRDWFQSLPTALIDNSATPHQEVRIGVQTAIYARPWGGPPMRVIIRSRRVPRDDSYIQIYVIRSFLEEVETNCTKAAIIMKDSPIVGLRSDECASDK